MASTTNLRSRRTEAQVHALAGVQREIRVNDLSGRRKYLQDFSQAFRSYKSPIDSGKLQQAVNHADIVLIGDYHALPAAQRFAANVFEERALPGDRPVVLGLETIFVRDQHIVDEWWRREISEEEFRQRIRFDLDWGYDWAPFYQLLATAREHAEAIYGLDCMLREDLRKIGARDRHAAHKIAEIRQRHPNAVVLVLFGESHLAPGHLPCLLRKQLPEARVLTILQNVDALYWHAVGEQQGSVEAVQVNDQVVCVFTSTPLEKYENYRLHLSRWGRTEEEGPDLAPTIYNLMDSLVRFLGINRYSSHNGTQPKFLVDMLPEVYGKVAEGWLRRAFSRMDLTENEMEAMLHNVEERGSVYLPQVNVFYVREFQMMYAAEEAARFLRHACQGLPLLQSNHAHNKDVYSQTFDNHVLENALAYFGSRVLYPARAAAHQGNWSEKFLTACEHWTTHRKHSCEEKLEPEVRELGYSLGSDLYDSYLADTVTRNELRRLFMAKSSEAKALCLQLCRPARSKHRSEPVNE